MSRALAIASILSLAACGSVEVPDTTFYRIELARPSAGAALSGGILGIGEVRVAAELAGDRLIVREGPVRVSAYRFHQWAGSLDQVVADALETGLVRHGCFRDVRSDAVGADWVLDARVLAFGLSVEEDGWFGHAAVDFRLTSSSGDLLLRRELEARERAAGTSPEAVVVALSQAVDELLAGLVGECARLGFFDEYPDAAPGR